jgi:hypothetical protein
VLNLSRVSSEEGGGYQGVNSTPVARVGRERVGAKGLLDEMMSV